MNSHCVYTLLRYLPFSLLAGKCRNHGQRSVGLYGTSFVCVNRHGNRLVCVGLELAALGRCLIVHNVNSEYAYLPNLHGRPLRHRHLIAFRRHDYRRVYRIISFFLPHLYVILTVTDIL